MAQGEDCYGEEQLDLDDCMIALMGFCAPPTFKITNIFLEIFFNDFYLLLTQANRGVHRCQ